MPMRLGLPPRKLDAWVEEIQRWAARQREGVPVQDLSTLDGSPPED